jgi:hypothetical protein
MKIQEKKKKRDKKLNKLRRILEVHRALDMLKENSHLHGSTSFDVNKHKRYLKDNFVASYNETIETIQNKYKQKDGDTDIIPANKIEAFKKDIETLLDEERVVKFEAFKKRQFLVSGVPPEFFELMGDLIKD